MSDDLRRERIRQVTDGAKGTPREELVIAVDFIARVINHADNLTEKDAVDIGLLFVDKLDAYLASRDGKIS